MASIQFVLQPLPGSDEQFIDRLREVSDKVNKYGFGNHSVFEQFKTAVKEIVIGPNHIGVLLEDGKAYRVPFSINSERLDLSKMDSTKNGNSGGSSSSNSKSTVQSNSRQLARSRARLMRTTSRSGSGQSSGSRSTGVIIGGNSSTRPLVTVPATYVPEELVSQAEMVLQGKSRNLIIRELQRTNLDVNLAVNNLLSRDDEEAEDNEEGADNYVPEDLISLLDNGFHGDNNSVIIDPSDGLFTEEIFSNYSSIRNLLFDRIRSERNQSNSGSSENNQARSSSSGYSVLTGTNTMSTHISSVSAEREAFSRWRDRQYYAPRRWPNIEDYVWDKEGDNKKKDPAVMSSPIWISDELEPWPEKSPLRFKKIGALYSEFIAISENGDLHQWKWSEVEPYKSEFENVHHPKTLALNLTEKIQNISANFIRCSVVTESDRVATWMDEQLGYIGAKLEHAAISFSEFIVDPIVSIKVCSLYTAVLTENNNIYWWGVLPFEQRRYLWDKYRMKAKKALKTVSNDIGVGTQVVMKKCPKYQVGSIGFTCANGVPKVGQLLNSVWDLNDVCHFKILNVTATNTMVDKTHLPSVSTAGAVGVGMASSSNSVNLAASGGGSDKDIAKQSAGTLLQSTVASKVPSVNKESTDRIDMPPPPSPASSTCSDTGSVKSHNRAKRTAPKDDVNEGKNDEEVWQLKDVVFVEDKIGPIGTVLKVDGDFVAVRMSSAGNNSLNTSGSNTDVRDDDWQQCRLLRREDVQVYKTAMISRGPDCLQKMPKKITIHSIGDATTNTSQQLLSIAVDLRGIHVVKKIGAKLYYSLYHLHNNKVEVNWHFPTDSASFMGLSSKKISMFCNNDSSANCSTIVLRDGNGTLYPMARNCLGSIKDPQWCDLAPVKAVAMTTISLNINNSNNSNQKSKVCMTALVFESQKLMPHILRCDVKNAFAILNRLEHGDCRSDVLALLEERCDGARNICHACVIMCAPTTNKDNEDKKMTSNLPTVSARASPAPPPMSVFSGGNSSSSNTTTAMDTSAGSDPQSPSSAFSVVSTVVGASSSGAGTSAVNDARTVSLRDLNRLINNDLEQPNFASNAASNLVANNPEDYAPPWAIDSNTNSNAAYAHDASSSAAISTNMEKDGNKAATTNTGILHSLKITTPNYVFDPIHRREHAVLILQQMCCSPALRPCLYQMLSYKDAQGQTPFMLAVHSRAYEAGLILLKTILTIADKDAAMKDAMIFPPSSPPDQSPLYVICYNDTCSFTWTGADHINQNIYECKTCGLTDSLCCCTECAKVCHRGHDCKLKRTSPTAYCDCWEKCKCKALIAGNQTKRFSLLSKLVSCTDLVSKFNSKGESILLFLIQTVGRQAVEQRQYRANNRIRNVTGGSGGGAGGSASGGGGGGSGAGGSSGSNNAGGASARKSTVSIDMDASTPDHDLEPPKFARRALERLLIDWQAVRAMIVTGVERNDNLLTASMPPANLAAANTSGTEHYNIYWQTQHSSTLLDKFTHNLFVKCSSDHLDTLLVTLVREMQNDSIPGRMKDAELVASRFVRSVARVFVIFNLEKFPNPERRKSLNMSHKHIQNCIKVFQTLSKIAVQELCEVAEALIAPVRLGVVRPTPPFMASSNIENSDELFSAEPLVPFVAEAVNNDAGAGAVVNETISSGSASNAHNFQSNYRNDNNLRDENEETAGREVGNHNPDEDMLAAGRNEEAMQDDESDNEYTFNEPETESDSDDNQSNQDAQRSVQTGATVGSETDESGDSSAPEEEGSEDGETDDHDDDEFSFADHQLERRNVNASNRNDLAPQSIQWAIRSRDTSRSTVRMSAGSNLIFIDPMALRRSTVPAGNSVAASPQEYHTMATTSSNLARGFGIVVRQISELLNNLSYNSNNLNDIMDASLKVKQDAYNLHMYVEKCLKRTWDWMFSIMDSTEAQLKFGAYLTNYSDHTHPLHPLNLSSQNNNNNQSSNSAGGGNSGSGGGGNGGGGGNAGSANGSVGINMLGSSSRRDFFTYCLSLMRAHTSEHRDALPVLDITAQRHIAFVLDAFIFYMRNDTNFYEKMMGFASNQSTTNENDDTDDEISNLTNNDDNFATDMDGDVLMNHVGVETARRHPFFVRSDSTLSLGCLAPDGFDLPLDVAIPLADKPHLLQPNSKREDLFANLSLTVSPNMRQCNEKCSATGNDCCNAANNTTASVSLDYHPTKLGFSTYSFVNYTNDQSTSPLTMAEEAHNNSSVEEKASERNYFASTSSSSPSPSSSSSSCASATKLLPANANVNVEQRDETAGASGCIVGAAGAGAGGNVYLQLKKKQYNEDSKTVVEALDKTNHEQMDIDIDPKFVDIQSNPTNSANNVAMTRPDIIIAPNKNQRNNADPPTMQQQLQYSADSTPPSTTRSVIVRAPLKNAKCLLTAAQKLMNANRLPTANDYSNTSGGNARMTTLLMPIRGQFLCQKLSKDSTPSWNFLLGRWKLTLELFGRVFMDDVGMEHGSVLPELRGFPVKEIRFRRHMEKLRNAQQRDLNLCKLERNRETLIMQTFKELNTQFGSQNRRLHPPLTFNRVKVTFKDEPGEGSGVARSFYTSISEALLAPAKMPNLESVQVGNNNSNSKYGVPFSSILRNRSASGREPPTLQRRGTGSKILWRSARDRKALNYDARTYIPHSNKSEGAGENPNEHLTTHLQHIGERLYLKICMINSVHAAKITGMLLEIPTSQLLSIVSSEEILKQRVEEALEIIRQKAEMHASATGATSSAAAAASASAASVSAASAGTAQSKKLSPVVMMEQCQIEDNEPLFYMPGKRGFYTPRQGYCSLERINAFRNIGRLIGLCLLQNELLPLFLQRHVIKYILGRKIKFHDLAFFDATIYESFRRLIQNVQTEEGEEVINQMELYFVIDLMKEEGGGGSIELIPGGREIQVTGDNLFEYIRRYTEYRLIKAQVKALEALRDGVFDILPDNSLQNLTAEDFRLLLNGAGDIGVSTLISYTTFNDESNEGSDKLLKFKRWFWSIVEKMNTLERQDLVYFWTGSPALPASEEGFQPLPSVTIRPADDTHLPTANTCISRLYIPLYSSKSILRSKLLLAIKSKNFGFV